MLSFLLRSVPTALVVGLQSFWGSLLTSIALGDPGALASAKSGSPPSKNLRGLTSGGGQSQLWDSSHEENDMGPLVSGVFDVPCFERPSVLLLHQHTIPFHSCIVFYQKAFYQRPPFVYPFIYSLGGHLAIGQSTETGAEEDRRIGGFSAGEERKIKS